MAIFLSATAAAATSAVISAAAGITSATLALTRDPKASSKISWTAIKPCRVRCRMHASKRSIDGYFSISGDLLVVGSTPDIIDEILSVQGTQASLSGRAVEIIKEDTKILTLTFDDTEQACASLFELQAAALLAQRSASIMPPIRAKHRRPLECNREVTKASQHIEKHELRAKVLELEQDFDRKLGERAQRQVSESMELQNNLAQSIADAVAKGRRVEELQLSLESAEGRSKEAEDELTNLKELCTSQESEIQALKERLSELQALSVDSESSCGAVSEDLAVIRSPRRLRSANIETTINKFESLSAAYSAHVTQSYDLGMYKAPRNIRLLSAPAPVWTQSRAESTKRLSVMA